MESFCPVNKDQVEFDRLSAEDKLSVMETYYILPKGIKGLYIPTKNQ